MLNDLCRKPVQQLCVVIVRDVVEVNQTAHYVIFES